MSLQVGSPAIDVGGTSTSTYDQRGGDGPGGIPDFDRVVGGVLDIGAYEAPLPPEPKVKLNSTTGITTVGVYDETITVVYYDLNGGNIVVGGFDNSDISIFGPGYGPGGTTAKFDSSTPSVNANQVTATYTVSAPAGGWGGNNGWNLGAYKIMMNSPQVLDDNDLLPVKAGQIGTFNTAIAVSLTVDKVSDASDANLVAGERTLREAIEVTSGNLADDTIIFSGAFAGANTITVGSVMTISDAVEINGPGQQLVLDGNLLTNLFVYDAPAAAGVKTSMSSMTLTKGKAAIGGAINNVNDDDLTLTSMKITSSTGTTNGGAIATGSGKLVINTSTLQNNSSTGAGGGIFGSSTTTATVEVHNSSLLTNTSNNNGGAIFMNTGTLLVDPSIIKGNRAFNGAAIAVGGGTSVTIDKTWIDTNVGTASNGAILLLGNASMTMTNSTVSGNTATTNAGGGVAFGTGAVSITNSTFNANKATSGGAIFSASTGSLTLTNVTIAGNTGSATAGVGGILGSVSGTFTLVNTIVAANTGATTPDMLFGGTGTATINGDNNLIGKQDATWSATGTKNQIGPVSPLDPGLNALSDNGGFLLPDGSKILTMSLKNSSKAIDAGDDAVTTSLTFDERGQSPFSRKQSAAVDVGAFEASSTPTPTVSGTADNVTVTGGTTFDVTVTFKDDNGVDLSTIDLSDVVVKSVFGGGTLTAKSMNPPAPTGFAQSINVVYTFDAPDNTTTDTWDASDTDVYEVWFVGTVTDADPLPVASPQNIATFFAFLGQGKSLVVTNAGDTDDGNYNTGQLTLREAMGFSNGNTLAIDTITFSLPSGTTITLAGGFTVSDSVTINGPGADKLTVNANNSGRHFTMGASQSLTMSGLKLTGGGAAGGGVISMAAASASVTLDNMWLDGNKSAGNGGAILTSATSNLKIQNSTLSGNSASSTGGAFYFTAGSTIVVNQSTLSGNTAGTGGAFGGFSTYSGTITIHNTTITGNSGGSARFVCRQPACRIRCSRLRARLSRATRAAARALTSTARA